MNFYKRIGRKEKNNMYKAYLKGSIRDFAVSVFFIICSTSTPIFSSKNGAIWILVWYLISYVVMLYSCVNQEEYNRAIKRENNYNRRHNKRKEQIKRKKKWAIEPGGWNFIIIKIATASIFGIIMIIISYIHQLQNYNQYIENEKNFFLGIWFDTYVITVCVGYYNLIVDVIKNNKGVRCKIVGVLNLLGESVKNRILNIVLFIIWIVALSYSFNEFSIFDSPVNYIIGFLYIIVLAIPF